jgi:hypothetical protein
MLLKLRHCTVLSSDPNGQAAGRPAARPGATAIGLRGPPILFLVWDPEVPLLPEHAGK